MTRIEEIVRTLPHDLQKEVEDFARFLAERHEQTKKNQPRRRLDTRGWAGALAHLRDKYASGVDLQHDLYRWPKEQR